MKTQVINFNFPILKNRLPNHKNLKNKILNLINNQSSETYNLFDEYYSDSISKLDWKEGTNFERPWVQLIVKHLYNNFKKQIKEVGLLNVIIHEIWFQQYHQGDIHGWHVHGHNFTGVYYLELDKSSPGTEVVEPLNMNKITIDAKEGDVVIFPSVYIHRAPKIHSGERKTIISFNFSAEFLDGKYLKKLNKLHK